MSRLLVGCTTSVQLQQFTGSRAHFTILPKKDEHGSSFLGDYVRCNGCLFFYFIKIDARTIIDVD